MLQARKERVARQERKGQREKDGKESVAKGERKNSEELNSKERIMRKERMTRLGRKGWRGKD